VVMGGRSAEVSAKWTDSTAAVSRLLEGHDHSACSGNVRGSAACSEHLESSAHAGHRRGPGGLEHPMKLVGSRKKVCRWAAGDKADAAAATGE
jgi:hypothetical protein